MGDVAGSVRPLKNREEEILKSAAAIFRQKGYHATPVRDIAAAVGLGKSGLYHHISSKEDLLYQIVDRGISQVLKGLEDICIADANPRDKLKRAIESHVMILTEWLDGASVALQERRALNPAQLEQYLSKRDAYERLVRQIVEDGIKQRQFRGVDAHLATLALLQVLNGPIIWYSPSGSLSPAQIAQAFVELIIDGMLKE